MTHLEIRHEYMELDKKALGIVAEINKLQMELKSVVQDLAQLGGKFINAAETHGAAAIDELDALGGHVSKKAVTYDSQSSVVEPIKSKRICSNCQQPGHTVRTCARVRVEKPAVEKKERKKRAPLTEEQRKKLGENLKKARAARKWGKP
jgi:hypothetical protein